MDPTVLEGVPQALELCLLARLQEPVSVPETTEQVNALAKAMLQCQVLPVEKDAAAASSQQGAALMMDAEQSGQGVSVLRQQLVEACLQKVERVPGW